MRKSTILSTFAVALVVGFVSSITPVSGEEWGDFTGQFVLKGKVPEAAPVAVTKDREFCGKFKLVDESLVVGKDGGIKNIVVYMYLSRNAKKPPIHPDYDKPESAKAKVVLDNKGCRFEPRVALLRTTQPLVLSNSDDVGHNTKVDCFVNQSINPLIPAGAKLDHTGFTSAERLPVTVSCNIHPWMSARLVIKDHPYMAVTDENGKFTIKNVPEGEWTFQFWQEKAGYIQKVTVNNKSTDWKRGRADVTIKSGENDLGKIQVSPEVFAK